MLKFPNACDFGRELGEGLITRRPVDLTFGQVEVKTKAWSIHKKAVQHLANGSPCANDGSIIQVPETETDAIELSEVLSKLQQCQRKQNRTKGVPLLDTG